MAWQRCGTMNPALMVWPRREMIGYEKPWADRKIYSGPRPAGRVTPGLFTAGEEMAMCGEHQIVASIHECFRFYALISGGRMTDGDNITSKRLVAIKTLDNRDEIGYLAQTFVHHVIYIMSPHVCHHS